MQILIPDQNSVNSQKINNPLIKQDIQKGLWLLHLAKETKIQRNKKII